MFTVLNKLDAVEKQLEAALYLHLRRFPPESVHTLIGAVRGIIYGLAKHKENAILSKWDNSVLARIVGNDTKTLRNYQNEVANFLKHADRDPSSELSVPNLTALNAIELQLCIIALTQIKNPFSPKLDRGLWLLGLGDNAIVPFDAILAQQRSVLSDQQIKLLSDENALRIALIQWFDSE